ncbi:MAG: DNA/RNA non-specific endonuclease, partial [Methyloligellaceae bacterium]
MAEHPTDLQIEQQLRSGTNEAELREQFGDALYEELSVLARELDSRPRTAQEMAESKVYILPGIMGSKLSRPGAVFFDDLIWLDLDDIATGGVAKLEFGQQPDPVFASGVMLTAYLRMKLQLQLNGLDTEFLPYDWRYAPADIAAKLVARLREQGQRGVTLVCHSMGGLVARAMAAADQNSDLISRIITIGTPNHGSYSPVQLFRLTHSMLQMIGRIDLTHTPSEIANKFVRHFPGLVEMMPAPERRHGENYFDPAGWPSGGARPLARVLANALQSKNALPEPDSRFVQIIGVDQETIQRARIEDNELVYELNHQGDGTVPLDLAMMGDVERYFVRGEHGGLCNMSSIINGVRDIIATGDTSQLDKNPPGVSESTAALQTVTDSAGRRALQERTNAMSEEPGVENVLRPFASRTFDSQGIRPTVPRSSESTRAPVARAGVASREIAAMDEAYDTWRKSAASRESTKERLERGGIAIADDEHRVDAYARRLIGQLQHFPEALDLSDDLKEMVEKVDPATERSALAVKPEPVALERVIGEAEEFLSVYFIKRAELALRSVGRIVDLRGIGFGTGFLVAPNVLITNQHVLRNAQDASASRVEFEYELDVFGNSMPPQTFLLRPDSFFLKDRTLDFALVAVEARNHAGIELSRFGHLPLIGIEGKIKIGQPVNILQHPGGARKQVVFRESKLVALPKEADNIAHYTGDTKRGSSGSPVLSDKWEVVALHNAGVPDKNDNGDWLDIDGNVWDELRDPDMKRVKWVANQGIRMSRLVRKLRQDLASMPTSDSGRALLQSVIEMGDRAGNEGLRYVPDGIDVSGSRPPARRPNGAGETGHAQSPSGQSLSRDKVVLQRNSRGGNVVTIPLAITVNLDQEGAGQLSIEHRRSGPAPSHAQEARSIADYADRKGYDPDFLCQHVAMPKPQNTIIDDVTRLRNSVEIELKHDHYSVLMSASRRLAFVSAGNVRTDAPEDGTRRNNFIADPRILDSEQADNRFYFDNDLDRGHLFRRDDGSWGETETEAQRADDDTFHWPNIAPQHKVFNQSRQDPNRSLWGLLENHVTSEANDEREPFSVFNGPIF